MDDGVENGKENTPPGTENGRRNYVFSLWTIFSSTKTRRLFGVGKLQIGKFKFKRREIMRY